jgi:hypothetical protein
MLEFSDWVKQVVAKMEQLGATYPGKVDPALVDAMVPYRMGLTPLSAARAFLGMDKRMRFAIVKQYFDSGPPLDAGHEGPAKRVEANVDLKNRIIGVLKSDQSREWTSGEVCAAMGIPREEGRNPVRHALKTLQRQGRVSARYRSAGSSRVVWWVDG